MLSRIFRRAITSTEYSKLSNNYLEDLYEKLDEIDNLHDVLWSNGVLTIKVSENSVFVLNK